MSNPIAVNGSTEDGMGRFSFATSLSQVRQAAASARQDTSSGIAMGLGGPSDTLLTRPYQPPALNIWAEGTMSYFVSDIIGARLRGNGGLLYVGVDYQIRPLCLLACSSSSTG